MSSRIFIGLVLCGLSLTAVTAQEPSRASRPENQKPAGKSIIRGQVIYADTGRPLRRAEVALIEQDSETWLGNEVTDRNGDFTFYGVRAGRYFLLVRAPDIVSTSLRTRNDSINRKIALGQLEDGFSEVTVDGRSSAKTEIRASRGGVITGRVLTENDEPIARAQIKLFQIEKNGKPRPALEQEAASDEDKWMETDSRGIYRIAGLPSGEYLVRASESNEGGDPNDAEEGSYTNGSMMVAFHPKALRVQDASSVKVIQGSETKDVDIRFTERLGHRVSGTVLIKGKPAVGAEIKLVFDNPDYDPTRWDLDKARTDSEGQFEIRSVPDGNYQMFITGGYIGYVRSDDGQYASVAPLKRELIVDGADLTNLKFDLVEGGQVRGSIAVEGKTESPKPLRIELVSREPNAGESEATEKIAGSTFVENNGFLFPSLPTGTFEFRFSGLGTTHYVKSITANGKDLLRNPVKVETGKTLDGVRILLAKDLVSLSGRALDKDDKTKSLSEAVVLLFPIEIERRRISEGPIAARTDKEGRFVARAAPGEYFVVVLDRRQNDGPVSLPTEASLIKNSSSLQKIVVQRADEKRIVEITGPSQP